MANPSVSEAVSAHAAGERDAFAALGLPRRFDLAREAVETAYLRLAAEAHPDRFASAPIAQRRAALERSAAINEAHRVLRDPVRRAEHLVKLGGVDLDSTEQAPPMDQGFLMDMIERRERVDAAASTGLHALEAYRDDVEAEESTTLAEAVEVLPHDVAAAARLLVARRYLQRLLDEIDERLA